MTRSQHVGIPNKLSYNSQLKITRCKNVMFQVPDKTEQV